MLVLLCQQCNGLTPDQIQNRTTLRAYDTNSKLIHDYFDIPFTLYSDPLQSNVDWTYFMSKMQVGEYAFKKFSHSTMSPTSLMENIMLSDYKVFDICNDGDTLDYVVALHEPTGKVQVLSLKQSGSM